MSEIFIKLLNMSISASWLVLCVVILRFALKKSPKWIACILWAMVAVRLLCPFSLESALSLVPSAETVPEEIIYSESPEIESGIPIINSTVNPIISESLAPGEKADANPLEIITGIASIVWIAGIAAMAVYALVSYIRIRKRVSEAVKEGDGVWICDRIDTPFILGLFSPRIILPSELNGADKEYVISHEKAHLSRMDHFWKPLGYALLTVYWFNPLIWIAYILLCRDIEAACDEKVIRKLGEEAKKPYAEALINCSVPKRMISACPLAFGESGVKERVKNVLNYKKPAFWIIIVAIVVCIATGVFFLTNPKEDKPEKNPDKDDNAVVNTTDDETTAETIEDKYNKAKAALTTLDDIKKEEISDSYGENFDIFWFDIDSNNARTGGGMRCYGVFENCIVLFESTELAFIETKKIADSEFTHTSSFALYAYHDNCLYSLEEAYDKGLISSDDIKIAAERHKIVEEYIKSLRSVVDTNEDETTGPVGEGEETTGLPDETTGKPIETKPPTVPADTTGNQNSKPKDTTDKTVTTTPPDTTKTKPETPSDDLLKRIEVDYVTKILKECGNGPYKYYNHASVHKYYGTYNGAVPVIINCAGITYSQAEREETVGGYVFKYSSGNGIQVWINGIFLSLRDAYYQRIITKENLAQISETEPIVYPSPRDDYSFSDVKGFDIPDVKLLEQIENDYYDYCCSNTDNDDFTHIIAYYGEHNGCIPVKFRKPIPGAYLPREVVVAGITIHYGDPIDIIVWKNGDFYTLSEAYEQGLLTKKEIAVIAEINNTGEYLSFNRY